MKYLALVYLSEENWNACEDAHCAACVEELIESGNFIDGQPLHPASTATTVRVRDGEVSITDGPFAETKEILAGFYLLEAKNLNHAIDLAKKIPPAKYGSVEIRPVRKLNSREPYVDDNSTPAQVLTAPR